MKLNVDVDGVDRTLNAIKRDIHRGMEKSVDTLVDNAKDHARTVISEEDAIFNAEVYAGFKDAETRNSLSNVRAKLYNDVDHAEVLEEGATFPAKGPPVEALLPWVVRKMDWSPNRDDFGGGSSSIGGDDDDPGSGGDGENNSIERDEPEIDDSQNWTEIPVDYEDGKEALDEDTIIRTYLGDGHYIRSYDGHIFGFNGEKYKLRPAENTLELWRKDKRDEWTYVNQTDDATFFKPNQPDGVLGYVPGSDDDGYYNLYRSRDLQNSIDQDFSQSKWSNVSEWEGTVGMEVVYRDNDGLIYEGEVTDVDSEIGSVTFTEYKTDSNTYWTPDLDQTKIIGIEDDAPVNDEDVPLFNETRDTLSVGDIVFANYDSGNDAKEEVIELKESELITLNEIGNQITHQYDDIVGEIESHPVSERLGNFQPGDRVTLYDDDLDENIDAILTGKGPFGDYPAIDEQTGNVIGEIPESRFIEWEAAPDLDRSKIESEMEKFTVQGFNQAKNKSVYPFQEITIYNPVEGDTKKARVLSSPYENQLTVADKKSNVIKISETNWDIKAGVRFKDITAQEQKYAVNYHFDNNIDVTNSGDSADLDAIKEAIKDQIVEGYRDNPKKVETIFGLTELNISNNRASQNSADNNNGWLLNYYQKWNKSNSPYKEFGWKETFGHEFGHGYSHSTPASVSIYKSDPLEYKFSNPWPNRGDSQYNHIFTDRLPEWQFSQSNPIHGYKEMYMFTEEDGQNFRTKSNGSLDTDSRDQMTPYGASSWADHVQALAKADAQGKDLSKERMSTEITELTDKQIFGSEEYSIDPGDYVAIEVDGETKIHEYKKRTAEFPLFSENPNEDVPTTAELNTFEDLDGHQTSLYIGDDGTVYGVDASGSSSFLTTKKEKFIGTASVSNYDPSLDEFPDLVESDDTKRLQEAANMAWWYQANYIEHDTSMNKRDSLDIVLSKGYSSTYAEEVMSTFTEALAHSDPDYRSRDDLRTIMEKYPFFVEEMLKQRKPVHPDIEQMLKQEGFL